MTPLLAVDLGGTKLVACLVSEGKVLSRVKVKTRVEDGPSGIAVQIAACCREALSGSGLALDGIAAVGVAVPGLVEHATGTVVQAPNLGWESFKAQAKLESLLGRPVVLENDVNAGLVGEWAYGSLKPFQGLQGRQVPLAALFVGTGVGGALMLGGSLVTGWSGVAGELGHMKVSEDGPKCGCGRRGCLEALASRSAIEKALGKKRGKLTSGRIAQLLDRKGSRKLKKAVSRAAHYLGVGVANIVTIFNPRAVVLGGGFMEALGERLLPDIMGSAREHSFAKGLRDCKVLLSALGDDAVPLGAAHLAAASLGNR
ncbi:MAG: ROK family protein [Elusimicrobia bacterium]|nr:ROK family protein [Elusimicrobiota bacterium]